MYITEPALIHIVIQKNNCEFLNIYIAHLPNT